MRGRAPDQHTSGSLRRRTRRSSADWSPEAARRFCTVSREYPGRALVLAFLFLLSIRSPLAAQDDRPQPGHWSCYTEYGQVTIYTTAVWEATALMGEVNNAFAQFLITKYGYKGQVFCGRANLEGATVAKLVADDQRRNAQWTSRGKKVVETTFAFDPAKTSLAFACVGFTRAGAAGQFADSLFLTRAIRIPASSEMGLNRAWTEYLTAAHSASPMYPGGCSLLGPDPAAYQAQIDNMPTAYNAQHPAIVHLDWAYTPQP